MVGSGGDERPATTLLEAQRNLAADLEEFGVIAGNNDEGIASRPLPGAVLPMLEGKQLAGRHQHDVVEGASIRVD